MKIKVKQPETVKHFTKSGIAVYENTIKTGKDGRKAKISVGYTAKKIGVKGAGAAKGARLKQGAKTAAGKLAGTAGAVMKEAGGVARELTKEGDPENVLARTVNREEIHLAKKSASAIKKGGERTARSAYRTVKRRLNNAAEKGGKAAAKTSQKTARTAGRTAKAAARATEKLTSWSAKATAKLNTKAASYTAKATAKTTAKAARIAAKAAANAARMAAKAASAAAKAGAKVVQLGAKVIAAVVKAAASLIKALIAAIAAGGWVAVVVIIIVIVVIAIFGWIFGTSEDRTAEQNTAWSADAVVEELAGEHVAKFDEAVKAAWDIAGTTGDETVKKRLIVYVNGTAMGLDEELGSIPNMRDVIMVYAVRAMGAGTGDEKRDKLLRETFHQMVQYIRSETSFTEQYAEQKVPTLNENGEQLYDTVTGAPLYSTIQVKTAVVVRLEFTVKYLTWQEGADKFDITDSNRDFLTQMSVDEGLIGLIAEISGIDLYQNYIGGGMDGGSKEPIKVNPNMPTSEIGKVIVKNAKRYLGRSYSSMDCSALTRAAYNDSGIKWSGTSTTQAKRCVELDCVVSKSQLQPGDLVFWKCQANGRYCGNTHCGGGVCRRWRMIHHVAIYIGGGEIIESAGSGVKISKLWESGKWKILFYARPYAA